MSTYGLDGVLSWAQARHVAATCARPLTVTQARLDEAAGSVLGHPLIALADDPAVDSAAFDGFAVCGEGPWQLVDTARLQSGQCRELRFDEAIPEHTDAVMPLDASAAQQTATATFITALDPLTAMPDERARPAVGSGIVRRAERGQAGRTLVAADRLVGASTLAFAAAHGYDTIPIVRPPVVGTLVLGSSLLTHGLPRRGRVRDALGATVPAYVGRLGARGNPAVRAPDTRDLLLREIDDADVDVLITTGSTAPEPDNHVREVLRDLGARWLIDGVAATPGAQMLMARLSDDRILVGLPGEPTAALAAMMTLLPPLIATLRGEPQPNARTAILIEETPPGDYADDTTLVPVRVESADGSRIARPIGIDLPAWAQADAIAVVPPGAGVRGDVVELLDAGALS